MKAKPTVFISYNQKSANSIADEIQDRISAIATVLRDTTTIPDWGSIVDFMKSIQHQDMVVMIITDEYLKSPACMFEVTQVMQSEGWSEHVMFVVADNASVIYAPKKWKGYLDYWKREETDLKKQIEHIADMTVAFRLIEEQRKIHQIAMNLFDFFGTVKESKNPSVEEAVERIYNKVKETVADAAFVNNSPGGFAADNAPQADGRSSEELTVMVVRDDYEDKITYVGDGTSADKGDDDKENQGGGEADAGMIGGSKSGDHMPILLLVDMSGSMAGREETLKEGIRHFVDALRHHSTARRISAAFEVGAAAYNSRFEMVMPITGVDNKKMFDDLEFHASGMTLLHCGFKSASDYLQTYCEEILSDGGCVYGATLVVLGEGVSTDAIDILGESQEIADKAYNLVGHGDGRELNFSSFFHYIPIVLRNYDDGMETVVQLYKLFPNWYRWKEKSVHGVGITEVDIMFGWLSLLFTQSGQFCLREDEDFPFDREDVLKQHTPWIERYDSEKLFAYMYNKYRLPSRSKWSEELSVGLMLSGAVDIVETVYQSILYFENTGRKATCPDLASYTERSQHSVKNALEKLTADGRIRRIGNNRNAMYQAVKPSEWEEREEKMGMYLSGSAGTGKKISKNKEHFSFQHEEEKKLGDGILYRFKWAFDNQHGHMAISVRETDNKMSNSSLIDTDGKSPHKFGRPLGLYNDDTMLPVFKEALASINVRVDGVYAE